MPDYNHAQDVVEPVSSAFKRPSRFSSDSTVSGNVFLTAVNQQRDQWNVSAVKGGRNAADFKWAEKDNQWVQR